MKRILPILLFGLVFVIIVLSLTVKANKTIRLYQLGLGHSLVKRLYDEGITQAKLEVIDEIVSTTYRKRLPQTSEDCGPIVVKRDIKRLHQLYDNLEIEVEYISQEDNWVFTAWSGTAKEKEGEWRKFRGASFFRILNGKIEESYNMAAKMEVDPFEIALNPEKYS